MSYSTLLLAKLCLGEKRQAQIDPGGVAGVNRLVQLHSERFVLMEEDLKGLLALARERGYQESAQGYYSKCHLCMDLRKHFALTGDYPELSPRDFYLQLGSNS